MHDDRMEKWKGMDEIDEINNTREGKEWKWMEIRLKLGLVRRL